ncbi:MAG: PucR family transcriptional regulator [Mycobacteriales bacterium]
MRAVLQTLLPQLLIGVDAELAATMGPDFRADGRHGRRLFELVRVGADLSLGSAVAEQLVGQDSLGPFAESARAHAADGLSARALRLVVVTSHTSALRTALAEASRNDRVALMSLVSWAARLGPLIEQAEMAAFLDWHRQSGHSQQVRRDTVRALLSGAPLDVAAGTGYLVCLAAPGSGPDVDAELRRITDELLESTALVLPRRHFVILLHPLPSTAAELPLLPSRVAVPVLDQLTAPARVAVAAGVVGELDTAFRESVRVWRLLRRYRYPAGRYDLFSVIAEHLVAGDPAAADRLRVLAAPLAESPMLVDTLRGWLQSDDLNRRGTAAMLHVHPNTLDRRLRHIEELTGLSIRRHGDLWLLRLAMCAQSE